MEANLQLVATCLTIIPLIVAAYASVRSLVRSKENGAAISLNTDRIKMIVENTDGINDSLRAAAITATAEIAALRASQAVIAEKLASAERAAVVLAAAQAAAQAAKDAK